MFYYIILIFSFRLKCFLEGKESKGSNNLFRRFRSKFFRRKNYGSYNPDSFIWTPRDIERGAKNIPLNVRYDEGKSPSIIADIGYKERQGCPFNNDKNFMTEKDNSKRRRFRDFFKRKKPKFDSKNNNREENFDMKEQEQENPNRNREFYSSVNNDRHTMFNSDNKAYNPSNQNFNRYNERNDEERFNNNRYNKDGLYNNKYNEEIYNNGYNEDRSYNNKYNKERLYNNNKYGNIDNGLINSQENHKSLQNDVERFDHEKDNFEGIDDGLNPNGRQNEPLRNDIEDPPTRNMPYTKKLGVSGEPLFFDKSRLGTPKITKQYEEIKEYLVPENEVENFDMR